MSEYIPANCLAFMQQQILSHETLVEEHQEIYKALRTLVVSTSDVYRISTTDLWLMKIIDMVKNASALNESLLNALTTRVGTSKQVNKTSAKSY